MMPSEKISEMPAADTLSGAELVPVVQSGINKHTTTYNVSAVAMPTNVSELVNDVPYPQFGSTGGYGNVVCWNSGNIVQGADDVYIAPSGEVSAPSFVGDTIAMTTSIQLISLAPRGVVFSDVGLLTTEASFHFEPDNTLHVSAVDIATALMAGSGLFTVDAAGIVNAPEVHPANGFTGTGSYTNFTIIDGIVIAAS